MKNLFQSGRKALALFALCVTLSQTAFAQNTLSIDSFYLPPTGVMYAQDSAFVRVKNLDTSPFSGTLHISFATDSNSFPFLDDTLPNVTIQPQGTFSHSSMLSFLPPNFNSGSNIVVVWSSGNGKFAADSSQDTIAIPVSGIHEHDAGLSFSILPSPAHDFIRIKIDQPSLFRDKLQTLYITDVLGRPVHSEPFNGDVERKIAVGHLPPGLYFLELRYENKLSATQKFVRSD